MMIRAQLLQRPLAPGKPTVTLDHNKAAAATAPLTSFYLIPIGCLRPAQPRQSFSK
jgi:hypothetical protein